MLEKKPFFLFLFLLFLKAIAMIVVILYAGIGLGPDEAQYWTWSRALDWGYYSKPPAVAWQIWLGTQFFGHTELGVRFFSILTSFAQSLGIYALAIQSGLSTRTAFWCGLLMAFIPIGILGSFLAITDGGFLLFWILACVGMASALRQKKEANPYLIGTLILFGALFKWPMYAFWLFFLICYWKYFPQQRLIKVVQGIIISLCGLLPSLWWNLSHDWATFRHVSATLQGGHAHHAQSGNVLEFLGSQAVLMSPLLFILFLMAIHTWTKHYQKLTPPLVFCGLVSLTSLSFMLLAAFFQKIQGNWGIFTYPTAIILLGWYVCEWQYRKLSWLKWGLGLSLSLMLISFLFYAWLPFKLSPFKHNLGWISLREELKNQGYDTNQHFLFSDKYQTSSILSFYAEGQKRAYFLNLSGARKNQFSYWPSLQEEQKGQIGYFIWTENAPQLQKEELSKQIYYQNILEKYFEKVEFLGSYPLIWQEDKVAKAAFIFKCSFCREHEIQESSFY